jgi:hypothetical protein
MILLGVADAHMDFIILSSTLSSNFQNTKIMPNNDKGLYNYIQIRRNLFYQSLIEFSGEHTLYIIKNIDCFLFYKIVIEEN